MAGDEIEIPEAFRDYIGARPRPPGATVEDAAGVAVLRIDCDARTWQPTHVALPDGMSYGDYCAVAFRLAAECQARLLDEAGRMERRLRAAGEGT